MEQTPEEAAGAKFAQHMAMGVQVAEAVMRMRQQQSERRTEQSERAAAAARAERTAQHGADRLVWSPALDNTWRQDAGLHDLGRAWGAAAGWADTDPMADTAARRVEDRLTDLAPNSMARFEELRETGWSRVDAMSDVLPNLAAEAQTERRVFVADGAQARADTAAYEARQSEATPDDLSTPLVDEHAEGVQMAVPDRYEQGSFQADADAAFADRRMTAQGTPHAADVAAASYPHSFTTVQPAVKPAQATQPAGRVGAQTRTLTR